VADLDAENPVTRSNDGRADPYGGFWIGTMGKKAEPGAGAIYRYYRGEVRRLYANISISNGICFSPDGTTAYFTDTPTRKIMQVNMDSDGWPEGEPDVFVDMNEEGLNPDGAVVDASGRLWNAQWGANRVACYGPDGRFLSEVRFSARQVTCPAFGGDRMRTLFATSAAQGLNGSVEGQTYFERVAIPGQAEHQVIL
jgi:sugar lactone lactonase YvrE